MCQTISILKNDSSIYFHACLDNIANCRDSNTIIGHHLISISKRPYHLRQVYRISFENTWRLWIPKRLEQIHRTINIYEIKLFVNMYESNARIWTFFFPPFSTCVSTLCCVSIRWSCCTSVEKSNGSSLVSSSSTSDLWHVFKKKNIQKC